MMNHVHVDNVKEDANVYLLSGINITDYMTMMLIMLKMMLTFGLRQKRKIHNNEKVEGEKKDPEAKIDF